MITSISLIRRSFISAGNGRRQFSKVGFIGLGNMGNHMAKNLLKKGFKVTAFDINDAAVSDLVSAGATGVTSTAEAVRDADAVITMLPTNKHVLDSYTGKDGILSAVKKNALLMDSSTVDPAVAEQLEIESKKAGARFVDAPVSGGVIGASAGTLTLMVGGSKADFEEAKKVLQAMGSKVVHCGGIGSGQAAKLCNNMLLGITMIGVSEAFNLGERLGLDPKVLASIINSSTGRCWSSELYNPVPGLLENVPSSNEYKGGFGTTLISKDLGLAQAAATRTQAPIPMGSLAHQIYRTIVGQGMDKHDFSIVYQFLKGKQ